MKIQALRVTGIATALAIAGATAACTAKVEQKAPADEVAQQNLETRQGRHLHGPVKAVVEAARTHGNLDAAQEDELDSITEELQANTESKKALKEKLRNSAVAVVRSGTANSKEFDQSVQLAVQAIEEHMQRSADAMEEIHGLLRPEQRKSVAAALRVRIDEKFGRPHDEKRHARGFQRFASHLMLSKLQLEQLTTIKKELLGEKRELRPSRDELTTLVNAFEGEDFRTALNDLMQKKTKLLRLRVADAGKKTDSVLSIFSPEQRELIADLILEGPKKVFLGQDADAPEAPAAP